MDYKKKYRDLVEAVKELQEANPSDDGIQKWVRDNVPELRDSEDERIRKAIILFFETQDDNTTYSFIPKKDILAWLEKQGERKTIEWTPNDEYQINTILHNLDLIKEVCKKKNEKDQAHRYQTQYNWLKTLKSKIKGEWFI